MPRTYATGSQRASKTASQPSQSQSQPKRKRVSQRTRREPDPDEEEEEQEEQEEDVDMNDPERSGEDELTRKADDLVRLALFTENRRVPLRREDITKKVLGSHTRAFNQVFNRAQDVLKDVFGMELVELRSRAELEKDLAGGEKGDADVGTGIKKRATVSGSRTYILRSTLDSLIIEHAAQADPEILEEEAADAPSSASEIEDSEDEAFYNGSKTYGSIISWSKADQLGAIGALYVVLALILVNGRVIRNSELRAALKRLRLSPTDSITLTPQSTRRTIATDEYLTQLMRQGYIDRYNTADASGKSKAKHGRVSAGNEASNADGHGTDTYEWRWGNRSEVEVGERAIAQFVAEFMVSEQLKDDRAANGADDDDEEESREARKKKKKEMEKRMEKMMSSIQSVAGGALTGAR